VKSGGWILAAIGGRSGGGGRAATASLDPVAAHVAEFERVLRGPTLARRSMIDEVRDGLRDAEAAYLSSGFDPHRAATQAVRDFGAVHKVAPQMQAELTARQGRWSGVLVAVAFPVLVGGWDLMCAAVEPWGSDPPPPIVGALFRGQELAVGVIAALALVLVLATFRRAVAPRWITALAAGLGIVAVAVCCTTGIAMNAINIAQSDNVAAVDVVAVHPLGMPVLAASIVLLTVVIRSAVRSLRVARWLGVAQ
jgi:hypothetical protein